MAGLFNPVSPGYNSNTARLFDPNSQVDHWGNINDPQRGISQAQSLAYTPTPGYGIDMSSAYGRPGAGSYGIGTNALGQVVPRNAAMQLAALR